MNSLHKLTRTALFCLGAATWSGCAQQRPSIAHYLSSPQDLTRLRRVVFLELAGLDSAPRVAGEMTVALAHAIQARRLFHVDVVSRQDPICQTLSLDGRAGFTLEQLRDMRRAFKCDGIIIGEVRNFRPYPSMQVGLYLRLMDLRNGRLVWAIDNVWDTREKDTEQRIRKFFNKQMRGGYRPINWWVAMVSPKIFEKFVAFETADTLPQAGAGRTG
jgi:hypothetical protein